MTQLGTFITLSTAHIEEETSELLNEMGADIDCLKEFGDWRDRVTCCQYAFGYWIKIPYLDEDDPNDTMADRLEAMPKGLADCMRHALQFNAKWILFDRDEPEIGQLMHYHW